MGFTREHLEGCNGYLQADEVSPEGTWYFCAEGDEECSAGGFKPADTGPYMVIISDDPYSMDDLHEFDELRMEYG